MATGHSPQSTDDSQSKDFDEVDSHLLEQTVEKLVRYGQRVGVTPEEMISLLDSGISIHDLLAFLASKSSPSGVPEPKRERTLRKDRFICFR